MVYEYNHRHIDIPHTHAHTLHNTAHTIYYTHLKTVRHKPIDHLT